MFKVGFIYPGYENLGIEYLSASLKSKAFQTKLFLDPIIFDESGFIKNRILASAFSFQKYLLKQIIDYKPDLLCFSVITDNFLWASEWVRTIKRHLSIPIVFGGIHPTSVPEKVIVEPFVDYVCIGEGDVAIVELAQAICDSRPVNAVLNIWSKNQGRVHKNQIRPLINDLNIIPFPDKELYYAESPIFKEGYLVATSRGCPFKCAYCCNNTYHALYKNAGRRVRRRSIDNILEEVTLAKEKYHFKFIHFVDDVFNFDPSWLSIFLQKYKKDVNLPFSCYLYPDFVGDSMAKQLKQAGCFKIQMGIQIINEEKRKNLLKRISSGSNIACAIKALKKENIYTVCDSIFGFPDETEEDLLSLALFLNEHIPDHCENFWLRYYPKTEITQWAFQNGYIDAIKIEKIEKGEFNF